MAAAARCRIFVSVTACSGDPNISVERVLTSVNMSVLLWVEMMSISLCPDRQLVARIVWPWRMRYCCASFSPVCPS